MSSLDLLSKYARVALRSWWLLLLCAGTAGAIAYTRSSNEPAYEATTTLVVGRSLQDPNPDQAAIQASHLLALTYADLALREPVLHSVATKLDVRGGWRDLQDGVEATAVIDTPFLELTARAPSPTKAQAIANEVARRLVEIQASVNRGRDEDLDREQFIRDQLLALEAKIDDAENRVAELQSALSEPLPPDQEQALTAEVQSLEQLIATWQEAYATLGGLIQEHEEPPLLSILSPAQADLTADGPQRFTTAAIAAIVGLLFGLAIVAVLERARDAVKSEKDITDELGLTLLGAVRRVRGRRPQQRLVTAGRSSLPAAEDYRIIRANIEFASNSRPPRSILVTSPPGGGGKTTTVANLGSVMAAGGLKTTLVDADLRRPALHKLFGLFRVPGLGDFLRSADLEIKEIEFRTPIQNINVITSGAPLQNPSDWLGSPRMAELLASLRMRADVVIVDSPPTLAVADALAVAKHVDGVLLVIDAGRTSRETVRSSVAALEFAGARVLGAILNRASNRVIYAYPRAVLSTEASLDSGVEDDSTWSERHRV